MRGTLALFAVRNHV